MEQGYVNVALESLLNSTSMMLDSECSRICVYVEAHIIDSAYYIDEFM
jgi:hypothetical protein